MDAKSALEAIANCEGALTSVYMEQFAVLFGFVEECFERSDIASIDDFIGLVDCTKLGGLQSVSILRATSRAKHLLKNWQGLSDAVYTMLADDPDRRFKMRGLLK